jgi:acetyl-CoA C-acetyltransferase
MYEAQNTKAFCELEIYEELGLCLHGEAGRRIDAGVRERAGKFPVNVNGGPISKGTPVGTSHPGQIAEIVWKFRGEAGRRQIPKKKAGLGCVFGAAGTAQSRK